MTAHSTGFKRCLIRRVKFRLDCCLYRNARVSARIVDKHEENGKIPF